MDEDAEKRDTMRKVTLAKTAGFCFGVSRAVDMVYNEIRKGKRVATLGPIIHNESVVSDLARKGVSVIDEPALYDESTDVTGMTVVIRSHGVAADVYEKLRQKKCEIVDSTCPFVKKIHDTVQKYAHEGYDILIVGSREHPEVKGIVGWCLSRGTVVETKEEMDAFEPANPDKKVCVVAQTTFNCCEYYMQCHSGKTAGGERAGSGVGCHDCNRWKKQLKLQKAV